MTAVQKKSFAQPFTFPAVINRLVELLGETSQKLLHQQQRPSPKIALTQKSPLRINQRRRSSRPFTRRSSPRCIFQFNSKLYNSDLLESNERRGI